MDSSPKKGGSSVTGMDLGVQVDELYVAARIARSVEHSLCKLKVSDLSPGLAAYFSPFLLQFGAVTTVSNYV